jgi:hypothetical protein
VALAAAQSNFMTNNLNVFDRNRGVQISDEQGISSVFSPWIQRGAGEFLNPKMLADSGVGDVFVEIGGVDWATSFVVAVYLYDETMHDEVRFTKIFQVGVSPGVMTDCHIAFPRFGGQVLLFFALNARGITAISGAMTRAGMPVPGMVASSNPTMVQSPPAALAGPIIPQTQHMVISSTGDKKEETRKKAENRIAKIVTFDSTPVKQITMAILVNGEINSSAFRSRMTSILEMVPTTHFKGAAFTGFCISSMVLGNFTSSGEVQKVAEKQSVRFDDLVVDYNPTEGSHLAANWKNLQTFRHLWRDSGTDTPFNASLSNWIQAWIDVLESGGSVGVMNTKFVEFVCRRKWASLGLLYQDVASDSMTAEAASEAVDAWGTWDRNILEMELLDWNRNNSAIKRTREFAEKAEKAEKAAKKSCGTNITGGGGGGRSAVRGRLPDPGRGASGRGFVTQTTTRPPLVASGQGQVASQGQRSSVCLDNVGHMMGMNITCAQGMSCRFQHVNSLQDLDRINIERDIRGIIKNQVRMQSFLTAMGTVKFKGE